MSDAAKSPDTIGPEVFLTKAGDLGMVLRVKGVDYECRDSAELDATARRFEATLKAFDERFTIYQYLVKRHNPEIPTRHYPENPVLEHALSTRAAHLRSKGERLYELETYLVVLYRGLGHRTRASDRSDVAKAPP